MFSKAAQRKCIVLQHVPQLLGLGGDQTISITLLGEQDQHYSGAFAHVVSVYYWENNAYVCFTHSCSQFLDNSVLVWEVRRPFIPFASFAEHSDDVTGETCLINFGLSTFEESIYHIFSIHTFLCALPLVSRNFDPFCISCNHELYYMCICSIQ